MCERHDMSENSFWVKVWAIISVVALVFICVSGYNINHYNIQYQQMYNKCITDNGTWIPTRQGEAVCLKK